MKAYINDSRKIVHIVTDNPTDACHLGFYFVRNFRELVDEGWIVYCVKSFVGRDKHREVDEVVSAYQLAEAIRICTHSCFRHKVME